MYVDKIAVNIRNIRINLGYSIHKASRLSGISKSTISSFEVKKREISLKNICALACAYGIGLEYGSVAKIVGNNIKKYRLKIGYSYEQLATKMYLSEDRVIKYENSVVNMSLRMIIRFAGVLGVKSSEICSFSELETSYNKIEDYYIDYSGPSISNEVVELCRCVRLYYIIDGDTIKTNISRDGRVRLLGIDTPEVTKRLEMWGILSKDFVEYLVSISSNIVIEYDSNSNIRDEYNRELGWVWLRINGEYQLLNYILVECGFANNKYLHSNCKYYDEMIKAQLDAKDNKRIIWGYKYLDRYWDYVKNLHKVRFYVVKLDCNYVEFFDYEMSKLILGDKYTRLRSIDEAKYAQNIINTKYNTKDAEIIVMYE